MSVRNLAIDQPASFVFTGENLEQSKYIIAKYPVGKQASAVIPLLDMAQRQEGWVSRPAIECVAKMLDMPVIRVLEVATFYTMFNLQPVGRTHIQVCTSLSCVLRGSNDVVKACKETLRIGFGETTSDGAFTLSEVECAGAGVNAPVAQVEDDYYEDLDFDSTVKIIEGFKRGERPTIGSQSGRTGSAPVGEPTSLTEDPTKQVEKQDLVVAKMAFQKTQADLAARPADDPGKKV